MRSRGKEILIVGSFVLIAVAGLAFSAEAKERVIILGDYSVLRTLDPAFVALSQDIMISRNIHQSLLRYRFNTSEIEGDLARSWTVSNDGMVYTFKLLENVQWHKGFGKFTAHDVKYTVDRIMDPKTAAPTRSEILNEIKEIRVIDDYTVEFQLKYACVPFLHKLVGPRGTGIVNSKSMEKFGKDFARNPVGTGPFLFESWTREQCVLVANKDFQQREGPPKIDKVIYKIIPDVDTCVLALQKGEVDMLWVMPREQAVVDRMKAVGRKITFSQRPTWQHLVMNTKKKPFDDVRVRQAIAYAIDKDSLVKHVFGGMAERLDSLIPKGFFGHTEKDIPRYDYSPEKARELLSKAGYPNGFEVNLDTFQSPSYLPLATAIADQLRKVGITAKLVVTDQATWWGKLSKATTDFSLVLPSLQPDADFPLMRYYHSSAFSPGINVSKYDQLDDLIEKARKERDEKRRLEDYYQIQKKLMEDLPVIPLMMMIYAVPYKSHIAGVAERDYVWGLDFYPMHFVEK